jgi:hypothetical protein
MLSRAAALTLHAHRDAPQGNAPRMEWTSSANVIEQNLDHCDFQLEP